jgi:serine protease Do
LLALGLAAVVTACSTVERGVPENAPPRVATDLPTLWAARLKTVVAIEFVTESEIDRRPSVSMGTVIDSQGTIILPPEAVDARVATWQLKEFKIYLPSEATGTPGEYLGQDAFTGWHFVRATDPAVKAQLEPITKYVAANSRPVALADFVWGIGLRDKDEDFAPYIMQSNVALIQSLPQRTAIAQREVAAPGLPVFDREGNFVGIAESSFGQSYLQFSRESRGSAVVLINVEESSAFATADEVVPYLDRVPKNVSGRPIAWLGAYGLGPMDRDVAKFFHLENQSGAVVSQVLEGSPAEKAGLKDRDIILALDGKPLPQFRPDRVVVAYIEREIDRRNPGDVLSIGVLRGSERLELKATLAEQPKLAREAERKYFDRLGFTVREFVYGDAVDRRVRTTDASGVIVHFVKPSSPAAVAGMFFDDWIKEIDGVEVKTFADAVERLSAIERDVQRPDCVVLVVRGGETAVLRLKLR